MFQRDEILLLDISGIIWTYHMAWIERWPASHFSGWWLHHAGDRKKGLLAALNIDTPLPRPDPTSSLAAMIAWEHRGTAWNSLPPGNLHHLSTILYILIISDPPDPVKPTVEILPIWDLKLIETCPQSFKGIMIGLISLISHIARSNSSYSRQTTSNSSHLANSAWKVVVYILQIFYIYTV